MTLLEQNIVKKYKRPQICKKHKPKSDKHGSGLSYIEWLDWSEKQHEAGNVQTTCHKCGRKFFPDEL